MELFKLTLISKNNKRTGIYLYRPIIKVGDKFFWCGSIKTRQPIKKTEITPSMLVMDREIPKQFYQANGIN